MDVEPRIVANGAYTTFEGMTWALPGELMNDCAWRLRYGKPTPEDLMYAAGIIEGYCQLTVIDNQTVRNGKIRQIRKAYKKQSSIGGGNG